MSKDNREISVKIIVEKYQKWVNNPDEFNADYPYCEEAFVAGYCLAKKEIIQEIERRISKLNEIPYRRQSDEWIGRMEEIDDLLDWIKSNDKKRE